MNQARELNEPPSNLHIKKLNYFCDKTLKKLNKLYHEKEQSVDNSPCIRGYRYRLTDSRQRAASRPECCRKSSKPTKERRPTKPFTMQSRATNINKLAVNNDSKNNFDTYFSNKVNSKGITNQNPPAVAGCLQD